MLYVGKSYTVTAKGSAVREVHCANCGADFVYLMERNISGHGSSPYFLNNSGAAKRAEASAKKHLEEAMAEQDVVACPGCGWYQPAMIKQVRKKIWKYFAVSVVLYVPVCFVVYQ